MSSHDSPSPGVASASQPLAAPPGDPANFAEEAPQPDRLAHALVLALASVSEPGEAGRHIERIQLYVRTLAQQLQLTEPYASQWPDAVLDTMVRASALHDIGNSAVPDRILLKPGALTPDELEVVRSHPTIGRDLIDQMQREAGIPSMFLDMARQIAYGHHERWDGKGYPQGSVGDAVPAPALVMALADAYDALTSDRVYRAGIAHDKAIGRLFQERGGQFAPDMVDALIEVQHVFADIAQRLADSEIDLQKRIDYMARAIAESP